MMYRIFVVVFFFMFSVMSAQAKVQLTQSDHIRCQTQGYIKNSLRFKRCLQELLDLKQCEENNKKKVAPYAGNHKTYCTKEAVQRFPDNLIKDDERVFSISYDDAPDTSYTLTIKDTAQYSKQELKNIKDEFVTLCIKERQKQRAAIIKTLPMCNEQLRVAR